LTPPGLVEEAPGVVFDFLKKKLQESGLKPSPRVVPGSEEDYAERRKWAENLKQQGRTADAISLLEELAGDLAGAGNFPLAVAVRHQIHQWKPEAGDKETPQDEGRKMATKRAESGAFPKPSVTATAITKMIQASTFLEELSGEEIGALIESTGLEKYAAGMVVVEEGTPGDRLYVVTGGTLSVTTMGAGGNRVGVGTLSVGDFFGEVALLTGKPRAATVTAVSDAECLQISVENWNALASRHPHLRKLLEEAIAVRAALSAEAVVDDLRKHRGGETDGRP
jgi:cAMP-dependent protein kinase regulator